MEQGSALKKVSRKQPTLNVNNFSSKKMYLPVPFHGMRSYFIASYAISWHKKLFHSFLCHFIAQEAVK